jgi:tetratricopeptide (TPR) repeat protein
VSAQHGRRPSGNVKSSRIGANLMNSATATTTFEDWTAGRHISNIGTNDGASPIAFCHCFRTMSSLHELTPHDLKRHMSTYQDVLDQDPGNPHMQASMAVCYLKLGLFDKAVEHFEDAIEEDPGNSETYLYAAVSLIRGEKPFLASLATIRTVQSYLETALMLENRGIYWYFLAYIHYDYYERKSLNVSPMWSELLVIARANSVTDADIRLLFELLRVSGAFPTVVTRDTAVKY